MTHKKPPLISSALKQLLIERFDIEPELIHPEVDLQKECNMDSIDALDLLLAVNELFKIQIPEKSLASIHTVGDLEKMIEKYKLHSR